MSRPVAVLRPAPGNAVTAARLEQCGLPVIRLPLFEVGPLDWTAPDPAGFDALLLTSANALRHGGPGLRALAMLPVFAVGQATARAAREAGFAVRAVGSTDAATLIAQMPHHDITRALHLGGRETTVAPGGSIARSIAVYASEPVAMADADVCTLAGAVAVLHSARAATRLAELIDGVGLSRQSLRLAAISAQVGQAAGEGWAAVAIAAAPDDPALIAAAARLAD